MTEGSKLFCEFIYCACGCGESLSKYDKYRRPRRFIYGHHVRLQNNPSWKNGRYIEQYKKCGNTRKHRLIYEEFHKCCLLPWIVVHHKNGIKDDNRIENLEATTHKKHASHHHPKQDFSNRFCFKCGSNTTTKGKCRNMSYWYRNPKNSNTYLCNKCFLKYRRLNKYII